jgi:hypothetical protein
VFKRNANLERVRYISLAFIIMGVAMAANKVYEKQSHADTFSASVEAENGSVKPPAKIINNSSASASSAVTFGAVALPKTGNCKAPSGLKVTDIDTANDTGPIPPWKHKLGDAAVVYFATNGMPAEYAGYVQAAATIWSASPCVDARAIGTCPTNSNCVICKMETNSSNYDGQYSEQKSGGVMTGGTLVVDGAYLNGSSVAARRLVVVHELGHAASLNHRKKVDDIMYWDAGETVSLVPDAVDLNNILAIYGVKSNATDGVQSAGVENYER